ncbi:MAG TPA: MFS transporter [Solirubrobacteraceae bacterium]|nr:MFS transporter [Solirubrobacteraceae bacterium]
MSRPRIGLAPLLHGLLFIFAATQTAIVPLLARISHAYGLTPTSEALVLAAPGLATLAISMPAGLFADRLGPRRVTVVATALGALGALAQAAPSYAMLVGGRLLFGLAFGVVWTTGVVWLSGEGEGSGSPRLGAVATSAAAGSALGPALGGVLADGFGIGTPFLLVGTISLALTAALWRQPPATVRADAAVPSLHQLFRVAPRQPGVVNGALVLAIVGAVGGITQLLVPLELHHAGFSAAAIGVAFSVAALVYIAVSALAVRGGHRLTTPRAAAITGVLLAAALLPAGFSVAPVVVIGMLMLSTVPRAVASTVSYPLATGAAALAGLGDGVVIGLLNVTWALGLVLAPLIAGPVDQAFGPTTAYLVCAVPAAAAALWLLLRPAARARARAAADTAEHALGCA